MQQFRRPQLAWALLIAIAAGALMLALPRASAAASTSDPQNLLDLRKGIYDESHILSQLPHALPAYAAGFCAVLLLAGAVGFYEMGRATAFVLVLAIGGIVYKFYWPF